MFNSKRLCVILLLTALLFRMALMLFAPYPFTPFPANTDWAGDDQPHYDLLGWNLAQGRGFTKSLTEPFEPNITRPPGYPLFLAGVYSVFGHNHTNVLIIQAILDSMVAVFIFLFSLSLFKNKAVAFLAGVLTALCPFTAFFTRLVLSETLAVFLLTVSIILVMYAFRGSRRNLYLIAGLLMGFTISVKPVFVIYPFLLCIIKLTLGFNGKQMLNLLIYILAITFCILPWTIRNYCHFKSFAPQAAMGAKLWTATDVLIQKQSPESAKSELFLKAALADGNERLELDRRFKEIAVARIKKTPFKYCYHSLRRIPGLWISSYSSYVLIMEPLFSTKEKSRMCIKILLFFANAFYLITGILGCIFLLKEWKSFYPLFLLFIYITLMHVFFGAYEPRHIVLAWPLLAVFSGYSIMTVYRFGKICLKSGFLMKGER